MSEYFYTLMEDLYNLLKLEPPKDYGIAAYFTLKSKLKVGLQMQDSPSGLYMVATLGPLPVGSTRKLWLQEALRWNSEIGAKGMLAMNKDSDNLLLGHLFPLQDLNAQIIYETFRPFEERALPWLEAIERAGFPPTLPGAQELSITTTPGPMSLAAGMASINRLRSGIRP